MTILLLRLFLFLLLISFPAGSLLAHEVRPGFLGLEEFSPGQFDVTWKQPVAYQRRLPLQPILPPNCARMNEAIPALSRASLIQHWRIDCGKEGILGAEIGIEGLPVTLTDVLVRVDLADGTMLNQVLRPDRPSFTLSLAGPLRLPTYLVLGFQHILSGFDHILSV